MSTSHLFGIVTIVDCILHENVLSLRQALALDMSTTRKMPTCSSLGVKGRLSPARLMNIRFFLQFLLYNQNLYNIDGEEQLKQKYFLDTTRSNYCSFSI